MSWPVVLAYPEAGMAQDTIEDFHESALFAQHLDVVSVWFLNVALAGRGCQIF